MPYLLKTEPGKYSYDDLLRDGETTWDGITNNPGPADPAQYEEGRPVGHLPLQRGKSRGGNGQGGVGGRVRSPEIPSCGIKPVKRLKREKPLAEIREAEFKGSLLFRQFRLSVVPLSEAQFDWLLHG